MTAAVEVRLVDLAAVDPRDAALPVARRRSLRTRRALLDALGVDEAALARTADGKPYLPGGAVSFNVSHAHEIGVVALAADVEVGVDVEALRGGRRRRVLPGVLSPSERRRVAAAAAPVEEFLRCWTRKEALLKAIGCGLRVDLHAVSIDPAPDGRLVATAMPAGTGGDGPWTVADLTLDGYAGAVAVGAGGVAVTVRR